MRLNKNIKRRFVSFKRTVKHLLRKKTDFEIVEIFLNELPRHSFYDNVNIWTENATGEITPIKLQLSDCPSLKEQSHYNKQSVNHTFEIYY
jgi:hypothetical protein